MEGFTEWRARRNPHRVGAQIKVVSGEIGGGAAGRTRCLGRLQCRLDDTSDTCGHLVLKLEHIVQQAIEAVGPEMRARACIDRLCSDAYALARFAHRAFEDITHTQLAPYLLHIDR